MKLYDAMIVKVAERLRALGDESRLKLLLRLQEGPANVTTLTSDVGVAQASVSKHLSVLKQVGLVDSDRSGTQTVYRIADDSVFDLCRIVCDGVTRHVRKQQAVLQAITTAD